MNYITLAVPFFITFIVIEVVLNIYKKKNFYRVNDALTSMSTGMLSTTFGLFTNFILILVYDFFRNNYSFNIYSIYDFNFLTVNGFFNFLVILVIYDFLYYWFHRLSHERAALWAVHSVHHQSEYFNLTTALRQPITYFLYNWFFYIPLALLGVPTKVYILIGAVDLIYQFWVHTQFIDKLGVFDRIFVTPSNHRVHHAINDIYLDKNYGGILIIWDRIFGTFQNELDKEKIVYGVKIQPNTWNPFWLNLDVWKYILRDFMKAKKFYQKIYLWFSRTGWHPENTKKFYDEIVVTDKNFKLFNPKISLNLSLYCLLQYVICSLVLTLILDQEFKIHKLYLFIYCLPLWFSVFTIGRILHKSKFKDYKLWEYLRLISGFGFFSYIFFANAHFSNFLLGKDLVLILKNYNIFLIIQAYFIFSLIGFNFAIHTKDTMENFQEV